MAVGLSEINAFTPQADLAKGDMYAPINLDNALRYGAQAAQSYSDNILKRYAMHQKMISDFVQNHQLDYAGVLQKDIQTLKKRAIDYFGKIGQDPKRINEIGNDPEWQGIQADLAQSKADNSLLDLQNQFRRTNPELYNQTNDAKQAAYINKPLGTRSAQDIQWDLPTTLDFPALVKTVRDNTGEKWGDVAAAEDLPGYFRKREGKQYPRQEFDDLVTNIYQSDSMVGKDKFGHTIQQSVQSHFGLQPDIIKRKFIDIAKQTGSNDPAYEWYKKMMGDSYKDLIVEKETLIEDKMYLENLKFKHDKIMEDIKAGNKRGLLSFSHDLKEQDADKQLEWLNSFTDYLIDDATKTGKEFVVGANGGESVYKLKITPKLKEEFAIASISQNPPYTKIMRYPDEVVVTEDGAIRPLFYTDKATKTIDEAKSQPVTKEEFKARIGKEFLAPKVLGESLETVNFSDDGEVQVTTGTPAPAQPPSKVTRETTKIKIISDYPADIQEGIKRVMQKNNVSEAVAIKALQDKGKIPK